LITRAGRVGALGFETACQLAKLNFHVVLTVRKAEQSEARARELQAEGLTVTPLHLDITDEEMVFTAD
jgi:short chain dehydrogenase